MGCLILVRWLDLFGSCLVFFPWDETHHEITLKIEGLLQPFAANERFLGSHSVHASLWLILGDGSCQFSLVFFTGGYTVTRIRRIRHAIQNMLFEYVSLIFHTCAPFVFIENTIDVVWVRALKSHDVTWQIPRPDYTHLLWSTNNFATLGSLDMWGNLKVGGIFRMVFSGYFLSW